MTKEISPQLAYYRRNKGSARIQANRDRYNAKRRTGAAKGNYGPRSGKRGRPGPGSENPFPLSFAEPMFS